MRKIILASHGTFAVGLKDSAKLICGDVADNIITYSLCEGGTAEDFAKEIEFIRNDNGVDEVVILTDLFGASVCNAMTRLTLFDDVILFSGMNLAMLLDILLVYQDKLNVNVIKEIVVNAQVNIKQVKIEINNEEDDF